MEELFSFNEPQRFWRICEPIPLDTWGSAALAAGYSFPDLVPLAENDKSIQALLLHILGEGRLGADRYRLSTLKSTYYSFARPLLPAWARPLLRKVWRSNTERKSVSNWPIDERFVGFQRECLSQALAITGRTEAEFVGLWPNGYTFAFVLTHDVEGQAGHDFVRELMTLEERYGFRSLFNFVPELYRVDQKLLDEMRERGFEVGVHGLRHDGRLFSTRKMFDRRVKRINRYIKNWGAVGFRSPMMHRNPEWMQSLNVEYDLSFFDTDPFEPMPGGTMSIWPFFIGHFVELPYTLMQDHTLLQVLGERTPRLWLEKVSFIQQNHGMVLVNTHPDYLRPPHQFAVYESFLHAMSEKRDCWHALPRDVARWWRRRAHAEVGLLDGRWAVVDMADGVIWRAKKELSGLQVGPATATEAKLP